MLVSQSPFFRKKVNTAFSPIFPTFYFTNLELKLRKILKKIHKKMGNKNIL